MYDEMLDIVDANDCVIRQELRSIVYAQKLSFFRAINAFIVNANKELWIPRRTATKKLFPLHLDTSVGGHVSAGEDYDTAFMRETEEELGLAPGSYTYTKIARLTPQQHATAAFMWVYIIHLNDVPPFNRDDFAEFYWLTPTALIDRLQNNHDRGKSDLIKIVTHIKDLI